MITKNYIRFLLSIDKRYQDTRIFWVEAERRLCQIIYSFPLHLSEQQLLLTSGSGHKF